MAKIRRDEVITAALDVLNDVGLDALSTRRIAERLGVESPTLYWHFRDKATMLGDMATAALAKHLDAEVPSNAEIWQSWFLENAQSFRRALLAYRDGARLHAGLKPSPEHTAVLGRKIAYLVRVGFSEQHAVMALLTMSQFTIGCVLEEQARTGEKAKTLGIVPSEKGSAPTKPMSAWLVHDTITDPNTAFEYGLSLIVGGLRESLKG